MGGQDKIRPLWRHYYTGTQVSNCQLCVCSSLLLHQIWSNLDLIWLDQILNLIWSSLLLHQGLIFVVDCADRDRIDEARQELHRFHSILTIAKLKQSSIACFFASRCIWSSSIRIINDREMRDAIILIFAVRSEKRYWNNSIMTSLSQNKID